MHPDIRVDTPPRGSRLPLWTLLLASLAAAGCNSGKPQFAFREEVRELMPEAQLYVEEVLEDNFGTPTDSVAWERMPIHFHAATSTVASVTDGNSAELTMTAPAPEDSEDEPAEGAFEQWLPIAAADETQPGMEVLFVSGDVYDHIRAQQLAHAADQSKPLARALRVQSYDPQTHKLILASAPPVAPKPGDRLIIGPGEMLKRGRMLYAEHCQHCHGVSGDGNGPTAQYLNPLPRDYRQAVFKFTSTQTPNRAQRSDLARTIEDGIPGTYMPSFKLLKPEESTALVEYVLWLACRGEAELRRALALQDYTEETAREDRSAALQSFAEAFESQFPVDFDDEATQIAEFWQEAQQPEAVVVPASGRIESSPESIARGREIFKSATAKCASCHGEAGKGDGPQTLAVQPDKQGKPRDVPGLFDDWNQPIQPRNLTTGIYRGGRRPVDIYRRIFAGIKGTPMTGFGASLKNEQIWDLVNYVMSIPFEHREPGEGPFVPSSPATDQVARRN